MERLCGRLCFIGAIDWSGVLVLQERGSIVTDFPLRAAPTIVMCTIFFEELMLSMYELALIVVVILMSREVLRGYLLGDEVADEWFLSLPVNDLRRWRRFGSWRSGMGLAREGSSWARASQSYPARIALSHKFQNLD